MSVEKIYYAGAWRTPEGIEKRKLQDRNRVRTKSSIDRKNEKARERYNSDEDHRNKRLAKQKKYQIENREDLNRKKKERIDENRDEYNRKNRERYRSDKSKRFNIIRAGRIRRNPVYGSTKLVEQLKSGELKLDQFVDRISNIIKHNSIEISK